MKKIIIISFYELKEHMVNIKNIFSDKYYFDVDFYPLFMYAYDTNSKINNYLDHFIDFLKEKSPDIILWWFLDVPNSVFKTVRIKFPNTLFIMYNPSDPQNINVNLFEKAKNFDILMTVCEGSIKKYKAYAKIPDIIFNPCGYDPEYFYPILNIDPELDSSNLYFADISFYCPSFYQKDKLFLDWEIFIRDIIEYCKLKNKIFKLFGGIFLQQLFPENYFGEIEYINLNKLYNFSKINICLHFTCTESLFLNEHVFPILGSGGFLFIDAVKNLDKLFGKDVNCVIIDKEKYINQIDTILSYYDEYTSIKSNGNELSKEYTWEKWVSKVYIMICKYFFSEKIITEFYYIEGDKNYLWNYWLSKFNEGINLMCFNIDVPSLFDHKGYSDMNNINITFKTKDEQIKKIYIEWLKNGKNSDYIGKGRGGNNASLFSKELFTTNSRIYDLCSAFNIVRDYKSTKIGLIKVAKIANSNPGILINDILDFYMESC